jgi:hypothetical protein
MKYPTQSQVAEFVERADLIRSGGRREARHWYPHIPSRSKMIKYVGHHSGYGIGIARCRYKSGYRIQMGCRFLLPAAAERHWKRVKRDIEKQQQDAKPIDKRLTRYFGIRHARACYMLELLPKLEKKARRLGWVK